MLSLAEIEAGAALVHRHMAPTAQHRWSLLCRRAGAEVWVKHENHGPIGAFKLRGGLTYMSALVEAQPGLPGVITATRGNHGQSIGFAARALGVPAVIVVPHGNSSEKNAAMAALGVELIVHGHDYQEAREFTETLAEARGLHYIGPFDWRLVTGVASYALELHRAVPDLDTLYVPVGMGSGICANIAVRDALGRATKIVGVVAENAPMYALSFRKGEAVSTNSAETLADGLACRIPDPEVLRVLLRGAERVVTVSESEIRQAMAIYYTDTHNLAEGAGAAPLAALLKERDRVADKTVAVVLSGGNVDAAVYRQVLAEA